jgi:hypothetical protein
MKILRRIWEGSPERDIVGLKDLVGFILLLALFVWLWGSILQWAGYTIGLLSVVALFGVISWWIAKKLGDENAWHIVLGLVFFALIVIAGCAGLIRRIIR